MTVKYQRPEYDKMVARWKRCRDAIAGQDAVQGAGEAYLPKLKEQDAKDYTAYVKRAVWYNASWRTMYGLVGMMFRKPPKNEVPAGGEDLLEDVTLSNVPIEQFEKNVCIELLSVGRFGVMVDFPSYDGSQRITVVEAQRQNLRPVLRGYCTESIINWKTSLVNNKTVLSMVVLAETASIPKDEFEDQAENRWRVLDLDFGFGGIYRVRQYRINEFTGKDELLSTVYPLMNGKPMTDIPFYIFGVDGFATEVDEPPMIDLVDVNLSHYRSTADYEHGCHFTGLPTPYVCGYNGVDENTGKADQDFYIGSSKAWVFPDPQTKVDYLEFSGQGLTPLKENLDRKESQMAILGARMIAAEKKQAETATTAGIHRTGENSVLASIAVSVSLGMTQVLDKFMEWAGSKGEVKTEINREFAPVAVDAPMLTSMVAAVQAGVMPIDTFLDLMQRADLEDAEITIEAYLKLLETHKFTPPAPATDPNKIDPATGKPYEKPAPVKPPAAAA
jgi:hypothetical protein